MIIRGFSGLNDIVFFLAVSQDCMLSSFVMITSFWMVFWEDITELFCFLSLTEGIDVCVNLIDDDVREAKYELTSAFSDEVESWD